VLLSPGTADLTAGNAAQWATPQCRPIDALKTKWQLGNLP
jgi:hypothetical protein